MTEVREIPETQRLDPLLLSRGPPACRWPVVDGVGEQPESSPSRTS